MEKQNRHIFTKQLLIIGIIIGITVFASMLYLYHNYWKEIYIVDNVPTSPMGLVIIILMYLTIVSVFGLGIILLVICISPFDSESEKQIQNLPNDFITVDIKDFDNFLLSEFISKDDISCIAKLDEDGKVNYSFSIKSKSYQTDDYELFLEYFDV